MKGYLPDTNYLSELVSLKPDLRVTAWIETADERSLYLSVLTLGEIRKGIAGSPAPATRRAQLETWLVEELPNRFCRAHSSSECRNC